jgi:hypothetical protein
MPTKAKKTKPTPAAKPAKAIAKKAVASKPTSAKANPTAKPSKAAPLAASKTTGKTISKDVSKAGSKAAPQAKTATGGKAPQQGPKGKNGSVDLMKMGQTGPGSKKSASKVIYPEDEEIDRDKIVFSDDEESEGLEGAPEIEEEEFDEDNEGLPGWWKNDPRGIEAEEEAEGEKAEVDDSDEWTEDDDWNDGGDNKDSY